MKPLVRWLALVLALAVTACGGGVGSGGTGIDTGSGGTGHPISASIGSVQGFGSIIVNGTRYDTSNATYRIEDATELKLGMTVQVSGPISADRTEGTANLVVSAADLRGPVESVEAAASGFTVLGVRVATDAATVFEGLSGIGDLRVGATVQVYGTPGVPGELRATRVEVPAAPQPVISGPVQGLDTAAGTFRIGALRIATAGAQVNTRLAEGLVVRVRAAALPAGGVLQAVRVEPWYLPSAQDQVDVNLSGTVSEFQGLARFKVAGTVVNASQARITGAAAAGIGNGTRVVASGPMVDGVLVASRIVVQPVPGAGGPPAFTLIGPVARFESPASFQVRGQRIDASSPGVLFSGGTAADLANGRQVTVSGDRVSNGVLIATVVQFMPNNGNGNAANPYSSGGNTGNGNGNGNDNAGGNPGTDNGNGYPGSGNNNAGGNGNGNGNAGGVGNGVGNGGVGTGNGNGPGNNGNGTGNNGNGTGNNGNGTGNNGGGTGNNGNGTGNNGNGTGNNGGGTGNNGNGNGNGNGGGGGPAT